MMGIRYGRAAGVFGAAVLLAGLAAAAKPPQQSASQQAGGEQPASQAPQLARVYPRDTGPAAPTGSVSGRAVFGDTQQPARFAPVVLIPVESVQVDPSRPGGGVREGFGGMGGNARTDIDGNFTMANVSVGDYYVAGQSPGYISETAILQARAADGADARALLASLPVARVTAGTTATVNISLTRGGTIAGRVQWEDGSPATGEQIAALMVTAGTSSTAAINQGGGRGLVIGGFGIGGMGISISDDRGAFRLTGLAPGTYVVRLTVQAPMSGSPANGFQRTQTLTVYAPGKLRRSEAQSITIHEGEERSDLQWVVDLHALHTVTGRVGATSGPEPQSGTVRLVDAGDSSLMRTAVIAADGTFTLSYVPSGSYTLTVSGANSSPGGGGGRRGGQQGSSSGVSFQQYTGSLSVADTNVSGVSINLTPSGGGS